LMHAACRHIDGTRLNMSANPSASIPVIITS
jgi:hypothetical protein